MLVGLAEHLVGRYNRFTSGKYGSVNGLATGCIRFQTVRYSLWSIHLQRPLVWQATNKPAPWLLVVLNTAVLWWPAFQASLLR